MTRGVTEAALALALQLSAVIHKLDGQAYSSTLSALNSLTAALAAEPGAAEGMVLVPVEPTPEMLTAGNSILNFTKLSPEVWAAMLAAAPLQSGESGK